MRSKHHLPARWAAVAVQPSADHLGRPQALDLVHVWSTHHRSRAVRNGLQRSPAVSHSRRLPARSCGNRSRGRTLIRMRSQVQVLAGPLSIPAGRGVAGRSCTPTPSVEVVAEELGPSPRWATATITRPRAVLAASPARPTMRRCGTRSMAFRDQAASKQLKLTGHSVLTTWRARLVKRHLTVRFPPARRPALA
jgi:hypothetical protein